MHYSRGTQGRQEAGAAPEGGELLDRQLASDEGLDVGQRHDVFLAAEADRVALGAGYRDITWLVLAKGVRVLAIGLVLGLTASLVVNRLRGTLEAVAVKAPGYGDARKALLEDLAVLTGGVVVTEEAG